MAAPSSCIPNLDTLKKAFKVPVLDGSLSVPQIFDWHREHNMYHPVFFYNVGDSSVKGKNVVLTYGHIVPAAHEAGRFVSLTTGVPIDPNVNSKPVIALMAASDPITTFTTVLGMMRAGMTVYLISPRNSAIAIAHILTAKNVRHFILSSEPHVQQLGREALEEMKTSKGIDVDVFAMPHFKDLYHSAPANISATGPSAFDSLPARSDGLDDPMFIVHSSGSTAFPKPVVWSSRMQLQSAKSICPTAMSIFDWHSEVISIHGLPMFHITGLNHMNLVVSTGMVLAVFPPAEPAVIATPDATYQGIVDTGSTSVFAMPSNLETWSKDPAKIYAAAPIQQAIGDHLVHVGVRLYNLYGLSETGFVTEYLPGKWRRWMSPLCRDVTHFKSLDDGTFELIVLSSPAYEIALLNTVVDGQDGYATKDVVEPHPTRQGLWRIVGRLDDQIMLSTGEKTNPGPLENILRAHPMVKDSLMFGRGHFQNGILVAPKDEFQFDPQDTAKFKAFCDAIWPQVEKMNDYAPSHSRLAKEMILVEEPKRPFEFTAKGFPRRAPVLAAYDTDIEALYATVEASSTPNGTPGESVKVFDENDLLTFVGRRTAHFPKETVLVTGTTGSLGTALLAQLVALDSVGKVYAFNRPSSRKTVDRQRQSLKLRGYDEDIATSPKVTYVDGSLTPDGINVNNIALEDEDCVDGVLGLTKFALSSPRQIVPRFLFASSIAVLRNCHADGASEVPVDDPKIPLGQGYAEGKWASEQILYAAQHRACLRPIVVRIGQISGGVNGAWNQSDWVPAIVKSSVTLGCFPTLKGLCSWLGVEEMAGALIDARNSEHSTLHLIHPKPMPWNVLAEVCAQQFGLELVPYTEWVAKLKAAVEHEVDAARRKALPAGMLLEFLEANLHKEDIEGKETFFTRISVDRMLEVSRTLREAKPIGPDDVKLWLSFWKSSGFL
ncbi:acetyl-CoA synthetase-like protein [Fistulina hepatica ATCC 64428]|nr:acetyl-CoA synthetase-like protein [Fistulina hepatica ATCC 64428]